MTRPAPARHPATRLCLRLLILVAAVLGGIRPHPAFAADPWLTDAQNIITTFAKHAPPRQVVVVFDDSGSMRSRVPETGLTRWQEARAATSEFLTTALRPGDSLTILPFDSIVRPAESYPNLKASQIPTLGRLIPAAILGEAGTNMRMAHDQALQILAQEAAAPGTHPWQAIIVVSDGFNDPPPLHSAPWVDYAKYCNVHVDNQNLYPDTPTCSSWRQKAKAFQDSRQGETFGIGVKVEDGVPEYRPLSETPKSPESSGAGDSSAISGTVYAGDTPAPQVTVEAMNAQGSEVDSATSDSSGNFVLQGIAAGTYTLHAARNSLTASLQDVPAGTTGVELRMVHSLIGVWITVGVLVILAVLAAAAFSRRRQVAKVRIELKDSAGRTRTFWIGGGARVSIGGKEAPGVFPLEVFAGPVAHLRHSGAAYTLTTEKGVEAETVGRKFAGAGPVSPDTSIKLSDGDGKHGVFEFRDISSRTRAAAAAITAAPTGADAYSKLDASLKG